MRERAFISALVALCAFARCAWGAQAIERGRYLFTAADCDACHTDPQQPQQPDAGGRLILTPFGNVAAANITSDRDTGIGAWSEAQFDAAVRHGQRSDGKRLYPAMPFAYYTRMSDADVADLYAYVRSIPAVHHPVRSNQLPFPFNIRALMLVWDALYFKPGPFTADAQQSVQWNRGAYLVAGPGHCEACHTPKNFLGADKLDQRFQGYSAQGWFSPDLTANARRGISEWSVADLTQYLKSGHNRLAAATGPMAEEISHSSSRMTMDDLQAIAVFLKSQPGQTNAIEPVSASNPAMVAGAAIYGDLCTACHGVDGKGVARLIPDIASSASVASIEPATVLHVILRGANSVATQDEPTGPAMPGFERRLSDGQIAAVSTYIRNSWGHASSPVAEREVRKARSSLQGAQD